MDNPRCVIFDLGNVIVLFDKYQIWNGLSELTGGRVTASRVESLIASSGLEKRYDRGEIETAQFLFRIREGLGLSAELEGRIAGIWQNIFTPNQPVIDLIHEIGRDGRHRLLLASNTNELHLKQVETQLPGLLETFDAKVLSFEIGHTKPERDFFERCISEANCPAAECVFVDDIHENCEAARATVGGEAIRYENGDDLRAQLAAIGFDL